MTTDYLDFCKTKLAHRPPTGIGHESLPTSESFAKRYELFPFQADIVREALLRGRCAIFADTGLGKSRMQLAWAHFVVTFLSIRSRVLVLAPLAVASQTVREGKRIGVDATYVRSPGQVKGGGVYITNYEMLGRFESISWDAVVLDESGILKNFMGATKRYLVERFMGTPFRLCCSATPAPNDHIELGNHSEFLGILPSNEMLSRWFINDTSLFGNYRLKGHAEESFWDWVSSWATCVGKPSDVRSDYDDKPYQLPPLRTEKHVLNVDVVTGREAGMLFRDHKMSASNLHREKRITLEPRIAKVAEVIAREPKETWCIWCETNYEADELARVIPEAVDVRGDMTIDEKEAKLMAFVDGETRILISKPRIAGHGLNFQHCARVIYVAPTFSYEADYQSLRRFHRFGQKREVVAHYVMAHTEVDVWAAMIEKARKHDEMAKGMYAATRRRRENADVLAKPYNPRHVAKLPNWIQTEEQP